MNEFTERQKEKILTLCKQISTAKDEVWDAFETTNMSDAKFSVYELWLAVKDDKDMPENVKKDLFSFGYRTVLYY